MSTTTQLIDWIVEVERNGKREFWPMKAATKDAVIRHAEFMLKHKHGKNSRVIDAKKK